MDAESWDKAEQLERQCQMLLAGCDVSRSIIVSLASRLVSMRELQAALTPTLPLTLALTLTLTLTLTRSSRR